MRRITPLALFESNLAPLSPEAEAFLNNCCKGKWVYDPQSGTVSIEGDFDCSYQDISDFKGVKFSTVSGSFECNDNYLKSLEGSPQEVEGTFDCSDNMLKTLEGGPILVGKNYMCSGNKLVSLKGSPEKVGGVFDCSHNRFLETLEGGPEAVGFSYKCNGNSLVSLVGCPERINNNLFCYSNKLKSFRGFPKTVAGKIYASNNEIEGFSDFQTSFSGDLDVSNNKIKSLIGLRVSPEGIFRYDGNPISTKNNQFIRSILADMRKTGFKMEDQILLDGIKFPPGTKFYSGNLTPPPGSFEKLSESQKKSNISLLDSITENPKELYSLIQKNPEGFSILAFIEKQLPEIWDKMKNIGRAKLSAEMGDLFY